MSTRINGAKNGRSRAALLSSVALAGVVISGWPLPASQAQTAGVTNMRLCTLAGAPNGQATDSSGQVNDSPAPDPNTLASAFSGVGTVGSPGNGGTGVALDRRHILTAAHLLTYTAGNGTTQVFNPSQVQFKINVNDPLNPGGDQPIVASAVAVNPGYFQHAGNDSGDIAVITLSQDLPLSVHTYAMASGPLDGTTPLIFVGYGQSGNGVAGYDSRTNPGASGSAFTTKRAVQNIPDGAAVAMPGGFDITAPFPGEQVFTFDFDGPDSSTNFEGGTTLGNDVEGMIGNGDSGGPAFTRTASGQYLVAGITSFAFDLNSASDNSHPPIGRFGSGGGGQSVYAYRSFINAVVAPEPGQYVAFGVGTLMTLAGLWRARRRT